MTDQGRYQARYETVEPVVRVDAMGLHRAADPLYECMTCGAVVRNFTRHDDWHDPRRASC